MSGQHVSVILRVSLAAVAAVFIVLVLAYTGWRGTEDPEGGSVGSSKVVIPREQPTDTDPIAP